MMLPHHFPISYPVLQGFGVKSKDYPIMEFNSANKAYKNTPLLGF
jgi:hypothetical protein